MLEMVLVDIVDRLGYILYFMMIIRIITTWVRLPYNPLVQQILDFIYLITEPILRPFRKMIPGVNVGGGAQLDVSPIIALFVLQIAVELIKGLIRAVF